MFQIGVRGIATFSKPRTAASAAAALTRFLSAALGTRACDRDQISFCGAIHSGDGGSGTYGVGVVRAGEVPARGRALRSRILAARLPMPLSPIKPAPEGRKKTRKKHTESKVYWVN